MMHRTCLPYLFLDRWFVRYECSGKDQKVKSSWQWQCTKSILDVNLMKSHFSITFNIVVQSFKNLAQSMTVILLFSMQNLKMLGNCDEIYRQTRFCKLKWFYERFILWKCPWYHGLLLDVININIHVDHGAKWMAFYVLLFRNAVRFLLQQLPHQWLWDCSPYFCYVTTHFWILCSIMWTSLSFCSNNCNCNGSVIALNFFFTVWSSDYDYNTMLHTLDFLLCHVEMA